MRIVFILFFIATSCNQKQSNGAVTNTQAQPKTTKHINIPGTRLYVIPPPAYKLAGSFIGLERDSTALVNVFDLVGGNFYTNAATYTREGFERKGVEVFHYEGTRIAGFPAKYIVMAGEPGFKVSGLVFGDSSFSVAVMANYPETDVNAESEITSIFNSIIYDKTSTVDPFANAGFTLDDSQSLFRFAQFSAGMYIYSAGGKRPAGNPDEPVIMVTSVPSDGKNAREISRLFIEKASEYGAGLLTVRNESDDALNGYNASQAELWGNHEGDTILIYQCVVVREDRAVSIQAIARKNGAMYLPEIKKLINTFQFR